MMHQMNPLGLPTPDGWPALAVDLRGVAGGRDVDAIRAQAMDDIRAYEALWPRRWGPGWQPPRMMRPADMLVMRSVTTLTNLCSNTGEWMNPRVTGAGTLAGTLIDAAPYWLPGRVAWGLSRTDIPDDSDAVEIRLPSRTVAAWFSEPLRAEHAMAPTWLVDRVTEMAVGGQDRWNSDDPLEMMAWRALVGRDGIGHIDRSQVCGVVLVADTDGRPVDVCVWIVATLWKGGPRDGGWTFTPIAARPRSAGWRALWWSLCAIVAWGDWIPDRPVVVHNRGKARRLFLAGIDPSKIGPVRVLDARQRPSGEADHRGDPESTKASPSTHLRRGHWRRQRCGPGRASTRLAWIAPTVVNPGHEGDWRETIWTLPPPESIPDTPTPDNPTGRWRQG